MLIQREESSKKVKAERDRLRYLLEEAKIETINQDKLLQQAKSIEEQLKATISHNQESSQRVIAELENVHITVSKTKQKLKAAETKREQHMSEIVQLKIKLSESEARSQEQKMRIEISKAELTDTRLKLSDVQTRYDRKSQLLESVQQEATVKSQLYEKLQQRHMQIQQGHDQKAIELENTKALLQSKSEAFLNTDTQNKDLSVKLDK